MAGKLVHVILAEVAKHPQLKEWKVEFKQVVKCNTGQTLEHKRAVLAFCQYPKKRLVFDTGYMKRDPSPGGWSRIAKHEVAHAIGPVECCPRWTETGGHCEHFHKRFQELCQERY